MIEAGEVTDNDLVLEIGPGKGSLTEKLIETGAKIIAMEKDDRAVVFLKEKFNQEIMSGQLTLLHEDVLKINPDSFFKNKKYKIIANIPYYITGEVLKKFLSASKQPQTIVFLVQKEVAARIVTKDKKESILSISVKIYGDPKYIGKIKKENFSPKPKVDSAILLIENISKERLSTCHVRPATSTEKKFFEILKAGFAHKRKKIVSNLKNIVTKERLESCKVNQNSRAEELEVEQWLCLAKED